MTSFHRRRSTMGVGHRRRLRAAAPREGSAGGQQTMGQLSAPARRQSLFKPPHTQNFCEAAWCLRYELIEHTTRIDTQMGPFLQLREWLYAI